MSQIGHSLILLHIGHTSFHIIIQRIPIANGKGVAVHEHDGCWWICILHHLLNSVLNSLNLDTERIVFLTTPLLEHLWGHLHRLDTVSQPLISRCMVSHNKDARLPCRVSQIRQHREMGLHLIGYAATVVKINDTHGLI